YTAVIAHPERNLVFQSKPELLLTLIRGGARTQITAGSFTGEFGPEARRAAESWLAAGLVHFVASDAHNTKRRPPRVTDAIARLRELGGDEVAEALIRGNPQAVLDGRILPYEPEPRLPATTGGLMNRIKRLWGPS
ncbi:MAG TPA: CpsB/CapC family capsule biosynthesis tyrosine phosphatase, partial [Thermoanaerobaculia bacterium]